MLRTKLDARPIPLQLAQDLDPARWSRAGLDHAVECHPMCLDGCAADRIHDQIDSFPQGRPVTVSDECFSLSLERRVSLGLEPH
jgi:hypothetical protein